MAAWLIPMLVSEFRQAHPRVQFRLRAPDDAVGSPIFTEGRVDLEFTARRPDSPDVHWEHLLSQPLALAVPADHHFAHRAEMDLADAADEEFVMLRPSWELRALTETLCASAGFVPRISFEGDDLPGSAGSWRRDSGSPLSPFRRVRFTLTLDRRHSSASPMQVRTARSAWRGHEAAASCRPPSCSDSMCSPAVAPSRNSPTTGVPHAGSPPQAGTSA